MYLKVYQEQLPPSVEVYDGNSKKSFESTKKKCGGPFDDFPSMHHPARRSGVINARDGVEGDYSTSSNYIVHDADEFLVCFLYITKYIYIFSTNLQTTFWIMKTLHYGNLHQLGHSNCL